jgi:CheY-like chemotaxis protein
MLPRTASSAEQAVQLLLGGETFDLALLDVELPDLDGFRLAEEIRKLPGKLLMPLVLLTPLGVKADVPEVIRLGFSSCLAKPLKPVPLYESLVRVISGTEPSHQTSPAAKPEAPLAKQLPLRLLLCDDNVVNQKVSQRVLQQLGYKADVANNGLDALEMLKSRHYDLIFMDVQMPGLDGLETTRVIRSRQQTQSDLVNPGSPIVIVAMTASAMAGDRERCLAAGMDDYLSKPVRPDDIRKVIERWGATVHPDIPTGVKAIAHAPTPIAVTVERGSATDPPVEMDRLNDFANGDPATLRELVDLYFQQTDGQMLKLEEAIRNAQAPEIKRIAHSCAGSSSTCGMTRIAGLFREMEHTAAENKLGPVPRLFREVRLEYERIRSFLGAEMARQGRPVQTS